MENCEVTDGFAISGGRVNVAPNPPVAMKQLDIYSQDSPVPTRVLIFNKGSLLKSGGWSEVKFTQPTIQSIQVQHQAQQQANNPEVSFDAVVVNYVPAEDSNSEEQAVSSASWIPQPVLFGNDFYEYQYTRGTITNVLRGPNFFELNFIRDDVPNQRGACRFMGYRGKSQFKNGMKFIATMMATTTNPNSAWFIMFDSYENPAARIFSDDLIKQMLGDARGKKAKRYCYRFFLNGYYAHLRAYWPQSPKAEIIDVATMMAKSWTKTLLGGSFWSPPKSWNVVECDPDP